MPQQRYDIVIVGAGAAGCVVASYLAEHTDASIALTRFDRVISRSPAIIFNSLQNASSRLMLVLCPPTTIERFAIVDFIDHPDP